MWYVASAELSEAFSLFVSFPFVKETKFEYEVHQNIQEERQNQLRWYVQSLKTNNPWGTPI